MVRAAFPTNETRCSGTHSAHSWDRQHFILTSPNWSTAPKPSPSKWQTIKFTASTPVSQTSEALHAPKSVPASQHPSAVACAPIGPP